MLDHVYNSWHNLCLFYSIKQATEISWNENTITTKGNGMGILRRLMKIGLILFSLILAAFAINHKRLVRVYNAITLFESDKIVNNFRSMEKMFKKKSVRCGPSESKFERDLRDLPIEYEYKGETKNLVKFLNDTWTTGLIVLKNDKIAFEDYYLGNSTSSKTISWSVAKSFISALIGIAVAEGHITDIQQPVTDYVSILKGTGYDGVRIKDVLQMSSGVRFNEDYGDFFSDINRLGRAIAFNTSLDDFVASLVRERSPGTYNHYVSMDTQVLGMVLREATGQTISSLLEEKIWKKIGMESNAYWLIDGNSMELAFGGLNAVLRDYARFGLLYQKKGNWNGEQIILAEWIQKSVTPDAPHLLPGENPDSSCVLGYGFQWWIPQKPEGDFLAIGIHNQFIYIHPKYSVVIAKSSAYPDYNMDGDDKEFETIAVFRTIARYL